MKYVKTTNNTNRLVLQRAEMPEDNPTMFGILLTALGALSCWGGADQIEEKYMGWEFDIAIKESVIRMMLVRLNCVLKNEAIEKEQEEILKSIEESIDEEYEKDAEIQMDKILENKDGEYGNY